MADDNAETPTAEAAEDVHEGKRERVRKLFLDPLSAAGMRFRHGTEPEKAKAALTRMADGLAYLSDEALVALRAAMETKGEGSSKCFWPSYVTVIGYAEAFESRPLEDVPELVRWFRSKAGREAEEAGRLAAEFAYWEQKKRPPVTPDDRARVMRVAAEWTARAQRIRERQRRGLTPFGDDGEWLAWYEDTEARARALLPREDAA